MLLLDELGGKNVHQSQPSSSPPVRALFPLVRSCISTVDRLSRLSRILLSHVYSSPRVPLCCPCVYTVSPSPENIKVYVALPDWEMCRVKFIAFVLKLSFWENNHIILLFASLLLFGWWTQLQIISQRNTTAIFVSSATWPLDLRIMQ